MQDNNYICELRTNLDINALKSIIIDIKDNTIEDKPTHQRLADEIPYFKDIREKIPFLSKYFNVYKVVPGHELPVHYDAKRSCALNIPVVGYKRSWTCFYDFVGDPIVEYVERDIYYKILSPVKEVFKFTLVRPTLINNSIPHSMINLSREDTRIILSWSIEEGVSFFEARKKLKEMGF